VHGNKPIGGVIAYPITPFAGDAIDSEKLHELIDRLIAGGANAIAPLGSTGESAYLTFEEWATVVDTTVAAAGGRVPVVVGSSDLTTAGTIRRAGYAQSAGADAVMILPISYWPLKEREIFGHYASIGESIDIPILAYNNPATSGVDMSPRLLARMFEEIPRVTMVKESTGDIRRMTELSQMTAGALPFFNGSNPLVVEAIRAGASGWCTAAPCLLPGPSRALYEAAASGDVERADALYEELAPFLQFIVAQGLPAAIKSGLELLGMPMGAPRLPLLPLDRDDEAVLASMLNRSYAHV
jgi:4-hydroxy-tetrahydrodipicolinate synthase